MVGVIRKIRMARNWFGRISVAFFYVSNVFAKPYANLLPVLLTQREGYAIEDIYGDACKVVSDFSGSIGS